MQNAGQLQNFDKYLAIMLNEIIMNRYLNQCAVSNKPNIQYSKDYPDLCHKLLP